MESTEAQQEEEITALQAIYGEDFIRTPPPKAWKGATRLHEFIIRVRHPDPTHAPNLYFNLHVKFPKTYPTLASPIFTIEKPIRGLNKDQISELTRCINKELSQHKGSEAVFEIVSFSQGWIESNVEPPIEVPGSLALQMRQRALEEEQAKRDREEEQADQERERARQQREELEEQIMKVEIQRQELAKSKQHKGRNRANSESTEVPTWGDTPTESFDEEIEVNGVRFRSVKVFHPRKECLGTVSLADPICDDASVTLPLQLYVVTFSSHYYTTSPGRKKLKEVYTELRQLTEIRHPNLISIFAVKLDLPNSSNPPQLTVLSEQPPALSLLDVLEDCDTLREERACDYVSQILSALNAVHSAELVHRGIYPRCIGLANRDRPAQSKLVKLGKVGYHTRLMDLHKSNSFGPTVQLNPDEMPMSDAWLSKDVQNDSALLYTRHRDIHSVGIILLQMLLGHDVTQRFPDAPSAMRSSSISHSLQQLVATMLHPSKKSHVSCMSLLSELGGNAPYKTVHLSPTIPIPDPKTPLSSSYGNSPEMEYFRGVPRTRQTSRWREDWEELELLGKGAFGSVVKARNKIDSRIYAVKKVRLRTNENDNKIFREVNALSGLSHRSIVRYYTTWVETSEPASTVASDDSDSDTDSTEGGMTSKPHSSNGRYSGSNDISFNLEDLDDVGSGSRSSFPSIHFDRSSSNKLDGSDSDSDNDSGNIFKARSGPPVIPPPLVSRTLYIQMEFVPQQTLRERVAEGIKEEDAWRLFVQILEALAHMAGLGILHRDIKLTNIFMDAEGNCKVGDFGLATSSLAAVDPSDVSPHAVSPDADLTLEVGTRLYIAPEVQYKRSSRPRDETKADHSKADLYSLGIVFFEMNHQFSTGSERIAVIENLRKPDIIFPPTWDPTRENQRKIITWLLQHDPRKRPTATELLGSSLLPARIGEENLNLALDMIAKPESAYHQTFIDALFKNHPTLARNFLYDSDMEVPEHASLNHIVEDRLATLFRLHGAVEMEPPLLMPVMDPKDKKGRAIFLDQHGYVVALPNDTLAPFARLAARTNIERIKRYHITDVYIPNPMVGHPKVKKAAVFDIITPDLIAGSTAAAAELIVVANECLDTFPNLDGSYDIHISHSQIVQSALSRVPEQLKDTVVEILNQSKLSPPQKRAQLLKKGLLRSTAEELEVLAEIYQDAESLTSKLERTSQPQFSSAIAEIEQTIKLATSAKVTRKILIHPLMLGNHHNHFKDGVIFEVVRHNKRLDVLAAGGRYDNLIARYGHSNPKAEPVCAMGIQIAVEKITTALAIFQGTRLKTLVKEQKSFGYWSPRRCDVYVISYQSGLLLERLDFVTTLWQNNISADLMYESSVPSANDAEHFVDVCLREGILFTVSVRKGPHDTFKVKSILKGTEESFMRKDIIPWLQQQINDQKRIDASTSGVDTDQNILLTTKPAPTSSNIQLLLPPDTKKQRKNTKQLLEGKATETYDRLKTAIQTGTMPVLAIDVPISAWDAMTRSTSSSNSTSHSKSWVTDDKTWQSTILPSFDNTQEIAYAHQIREAAAKKKADGCAFMLLHLVKENKAQLLVL